MNIHKNARLTPKGREILVRRIVNGGLRVEEAAQAWGQRAHGLQVAGPVSCTGTKRSPGPFFASARLPASHLEEQRAANTYREISRRTGVAHSTVGRVAQQGGLNRLSHLDPPVAPRRYVYPHPGDLLHLDIKRLGRFVRPGHRVTGNRRRNSAMGIRACGHDDHSRVSFACIQPGETAHSACSALVDTLRYFQTLGVAFTRVMTDNGSCYRSKHFVCRRLKLRHIRTRPYTPRTNGKAERFIQFALREWAYARAYDNSSQRGEYLPCWLHRYNWHRPHASLKYQTPIQSLNIPLNNVVGLHT